MPKYILALDQGTTSSRAILFDEAQNIVAVRQKEFTQFYPKEGWVEHDPMEIWSSQYAVMMEVIAQSNIRAADLAAIGITNQRETTILWDKTTGAPIYNAIVWQCRRTAPLVDQLVAQGLTDHIRQTTGLLPDAYFSATKIRWILDQVPGAQERAEKGEILFGTVDSWLLWKLTGGAIHATDRTNASRTMLYDIHRLDWDDTLLKALHIPRAMLPEVRSSSEIYGTAEIQGVQVPIAGMAGDQQAALFGQTCFAPGEAKNTYGTGCFLLMNTGEKPFESKNGLVTTLAAAPKGTVRSSSGCGMSCGCSARAGMRSITPRRCPTTAVSTLCPLSPVWAHPTGICGHGAASWASPGAPSGSTSSARRRNPSPIRWRILCRRWRPTPA